MRGRGLVGCLLIVLASGCGGATTGPDSGDASDPADAADAAEVSDASDPAEVSEVAASIEPFVTAFGQAFCHRVYGCCHAADVSIVSPGADEATCAAEMTRNARKNALLLLSFPGIVFDADEASRCLEVLHSGACTTIFEPVVGHLLACQEIFPGRLATGEFCDDSHECLSHRCASAHCSATSPPICTISQFLDENHNECVPRHTVGEPCTAVGECGVDETCVGDVCTKRLPDGASCQRLEDCTGTCASLTDGSGTSRCRPGYCLGD